MMTVHRMQLNYTADDHKSEQNYNHKKRRYELINNLSRMSNVEVTEELNNLSRGFLVEPSDECGVHLYAPIENYRGMCLFIVPFEKLELTVTQKSGRVVNFKTARPYKTAELLPHEYYTIKADKKFLIFAVPTQLTYSCDINFYGRPKALCESHGSLMDAMVIRDNHTPIQIIAIN